MWDDPQNSPLLTKEERDVLVLGAMHPGGIHLTNREIGQHLGIPESRVKTLIHQACVKLEADNRNEAIYTAVRRGEINLNELLSPEEMAELLITVDPGVLRLIAARVRQGEMPKPDPEHGEQSIPSYRKKDGILTNRERDVLILSSNGLTNTEIAAKLCMSTSAVRTFLYRAFTKLGTRRKADAVQLALKQREISVGEISTLDELTYFLSPYGAESIERIAQLLDGKPAKAPAE
jgi:DNA-binding CsgD family transcriptional regulator